MSSTDKIMPNNDILQTATYFRTGIAIHQLCAPDWTWDCPNATALGGMLIWLVEGGEATLESCRGKQTVQRGDFLLMPGTPNNFYRGRHDPRRPLDVSWLHLHPVDDEQDSLHKTLLNGIHFRQTLRDPSFAVKLMRRIISASGPERDFWVEALLREVARENRSQHETKISRTEMLIFSLCRQITENPARYRTLADLPPGHAYSRDHLIRLFKKHRGITPGEFMIRTRIDHARQLLKIPGIEIKQIAMDLGYPDPYTFSKQFKSRTGIAPGRFRSQTSSAPGRRTSCRSTAHENVSSSKAT